MVGERQTGLSQASRSSSESVCRPFGMAVCTRDRSRSPTLFALPVLPA